LRFMACCLPLIFLYLLQSSRQSCQSRDTGLTALHVTWTSWIFSLRCERLYWMNVLLFESCNHCNEKNYTSSPADAEIARHVSRWMPPSAVTYDNNSSILHLSNLQLFIMLELCHGMKLFSCCRPLWTFSLIIPCRHSCGPSRLSCQITDIGLKASQVT